MILLPSAAGTMNWPPLNEVPAGAVVIEVTWQMLQPMLVNSCAPATASDVAASTVSRGGTFNERNIAGTDRPSAHSYGIAIDLNDALSSYWRWEKSGAWKNRIPQAIVDAFEAEGFIWGGRWYHFDTMHFEYRPELLDQSCYPPAP